MFSFEINQHFIFFFVENGTQQKQKQQPIKYKKNLYISYYKYNNRKPSLFTSAKVSGGG
jgi:hypothetical protein